VASKAELIGVKWHLIEAEQEFVDRFITRAIYANSNYEGYPVSTSMTASSSPQGGRVRRRTGL